MEREIGDDAAAAVDDGADDIHVNIQTLNLRSTQSWSRYLICTVVCGLILEYGCLSHPFLLADNRLSRFIELRNSLIYNKSATISSNPLSLSLALVFLFLSPVYVHHSY